MGVIDQHYILGGAIDAQSTKQTLAFTRIDLHVIYARKSYILIILEPQNPP